MALSSMTGFADLAGQAQGLAWTWEARSVNGRGLDVRLRLPEGCEPLDAAVRAAAARALARGSVTVTLRLARGGAAALPRLSREALEAAVAVRPRRLGGGRRPRPRPRADDGGGPPRRARRPRGRGGVAGRGRRPARPSRRRHRARSSPPSRRRAPPRARRSTAILAGQLDRVETLTARGARPPPKRAPGGTAPSCAAASRRSSRRCRCPSTRRAWRRSWRSSRSGPT